MSKTFKTMFGALCMALVLMFPMAVPAGAAGDFTIENGVLIHYSGSGGDVVIPDGVTSIGPGVFSYRKVTSVIIPDGVTSIGAGAFMNSSLKSITIPASVTDIYDNVFHYKIDYNQWRDMAVTIHGVAGSYAESFAKEHGLEFVADGTASMKPTTPMAYASTQTVQVDGKPIQFQMYALKDANSNPTNYVKVRDVAQVLNGTAAQFNVTWDGAVNLVTKTAYVPNGSEMTTPYSGDRQYAKVTSSTNINGNPTNLDAFKLTDDNGGGYTYYKLRDLGEYLGFNVGWSKDQGVYIETNKPYQK